MSAIEDAVKREIEQEMVAEGIVDHEGEVFTTHGYGRKFMVELRVLEVTGA